MEQKVRIMVVDDEKIVRESLSTWLQKFGYEAMPVESGAEALGLLKNENWNILFVDLKMPRMDGIEVLRNALEIKPEVPLIIITAYATVETAVEAMKIGAYDYIVKPIDPDLVISLVRKIVEKQRLVDENIMLRKKIEEIYEFDEIIGNSKPMQELLDVVGSVATSDSAVLITGESGTGKELIARSVHTNSDRRYKAFIAVSIGALPETLVETEMFGHEKGAYTGAQYARMGKFELADGGTLFLDEIGEMSIKTQVDMLRVLEEKAFCRVGGNRTIHVDVRVIAATNRDPMEAIKQGRFREDLYYRLNVVRIHLPPLRERGDDILLLAEHFLKRFCVKMNRMKEGFSPRAVAGLLGHKWPGNVRELENAIERAVVVGKGSMVEIGDLPFSSQELPEEKRPTSLKDAEKRHILHLLDETHWNITRCSRLLEIDRATLYNKIKKYGLSKPQD